MHEHIRQSSRGRPRAAEERGRAPRCVGRWAAGVWQAGPVAAQGVGQVTSHSEGAEVPGHGEAGGESPNSSFPLTHALSSPAALPGLQETLLEPQVGVSSMGGGAARGGLRGLWGMWGFTDNMRPGVASSLPCNPACRCSQTSTFPRSAPPPWDPLPAFILSKLLELRLGAVRGWGGRPGAA